MITLMMTMMYVYCEKEISEVLVHGQVTQERKVKRGFVGLNKGM